MPCTSYYILAPHQSSCRTPRHPAADRCSSGVYYFVTGRKRARWFSLSKPASIQATRFLQAQPAFLPDQDLPGETRGWVGADSLLGRGGRTGEDIGLPADSPAEGGSLLQFWANSI